MQGENRGVFFYSLHNQPFCIIVVDGSILPVAITYRHDWCIQFRLSGLDIVKDT